MKFGHAEQEVKRVNSLKITGYCPFIQKICIGTRCRAYQKAKVVVDVRYCGGDHSYIVEDPICLLIGR